MVAELLLGSVLTLAAGGSSYLVLVQRKERRAAEEERKATRERFRESLIRRIRTTKVSEIRFSEFVEQCGISRRDADAEADHVYRELCRKVMADGIITDDERKKLDLLARAIEIDPDRADRMELEIKGGVYREAVAGILSDGVISYAEAGELDSLRRSLGIDAGHGLSVTEDLSRDAYLAQLQRVVSRGSVTGSAKAEISRIKRALGISAGDGARLARDGDRALDLYRQLFTSVLQDGVVTPEEEETLDWFQREVGLPDRLISASKDRIQKVKRLASYREGRVPSLRTSKILEGGEICHWDDRCTYTYETTRNVFHVDGDLVVTSKRVMFASPSKSITFAPSKIIDIRLSAGRLEIRTNVRQGNGIYRVRDPEELEAVLVGVTRKHKFLLAENYSSARTRHIPDDVKRAVWDRDGGRCVRCSATDYLEYDHIIPHGKGGSNGVNNVQILCRKCNNLKSDRI
jgi:hypothetical protein